MKAPSILQSPPILKVGEFHTALRYERPHAPRTAERIHFLFCVTPPGVSTRGFNREGAGLLQATERTSRLLKLGSSAEDVLSHAELISQGSLFRVPNQLCLRFCSSLRARADGFPHTNKHRPNPTAQHLQLRVCGEFSAQQFPKSLEPRSRL